jgi:uncharacterized linocin/CFP29 family protein
MDFILNGQGHGNVAATLMGNGFDVGALRPYIGKDGRHYVTRNQNGKPIAVPLMNTAATLRKDEWIELDRAVLTAAKERLRIVADIRGAGLTYNVPNGMGKTVLESQTMGDITGAIISMDPAREAEGDRPEFDITSLPLPVIHKDFYFNARQVATSRNTGAPIDTVTAQLAARRVAEEAEKLTLGSSSSYTYGGGTVYGFINFPQRITKTITAPTTGGWTGGTLVSEVLSMRQKMYDKFYFGPFALYNAPAWDEYLDADYSTAKGDNTLRQRIEAIQAISRVSTADFLTGYQMVLIQMTSDVVRMVIGMDVTTVQWETQGGMRLNFKVMCIIVPQLRSMSTSSATAGIVHASS